MPFHHWFIKWVIFNTFHVFLGLLLHFHKRTHRHNNSQHTATVSVYSYEYQKPFLNTILITRLLHSTHVLVSLSNEVSASMLDSYICFFVLEAEWHKITSIKLARDHVLMYVPLWCGNFPDGRASHKSPPREFLLGWLVKECLSCIGGRGFDLWCRHNLSFSELLSCVFCYAQRLCWSDVKRKLWLYTSRDKCWTEAWAVGPVLTWCLLLFKCTM